MARKAPQLAKLTRPRLHKAVARERLFSKLDDAREHRPAICVVGPPGAGKTTLVASWLDARAIKGIWYQVDPGDSDLATFFYYLGEAAKSFTRKGRRPLPALTPEYLQDIEGFSRRFFRDLLSRLPEGAVLVLDNYQEVAPEQKFHQLIAQAVGDVPAGMTLIAISRRDPPDCYARLIANEDVQLVDWDDLQLTFEETRLIVEAKGPIARPEEIERLHRESGGWAAGLTLILEGYRKNNAPLPEVPAGREAIFGYFAAQIFERVSPETQRFLVTTAFLAQIPVTIAREITECADAEAILEDLYRRHLFTHRRPGKGATYQYHALFREFLHAKSLVLLGEVERRRVAVNAARLLEAAGQWEDAFVLFCDATEWNDARALILKHAETLLAQGRGQTLRDWIGGLPAEDAKQHSWVAYWLGISLISVDQPLARVHLERAYELFARERNSVGQLLAITGVCQTHYFEWSEFAPLDRWISVIDKLLDFNPSLPSQRAELSVWSALLMSLVYRQPGHPRLAQSAERVMALIESDIDLNGKVTAGIYVLSYSSLAEQWELGRQVLARLGPLAESPELSPLNQIWWQTRVGFFLYNVAEYEGAERALDRAHELLHQHGLRGLRSVERLLWSYDMVVAMACWNVERTELCAMRIAREVRQSRPMDVWHTTQAKTHVALLKGEMGSALRYAVLAHEQALRAGMPYIECLALSHEAHAHAGLGEFDRVAENVRTLRKLIEGTCLAYFECECRLVEAYVALLQDQEERTRERLASAFRLAFQIGYHYVFRWSANVLPACCEHALKANIEVDYVRELIRRYHLKPASLDVDVWPWPIAVRALGGFDIYRNGDRVEFSGKAPKKPLALLKAIVAFGGNVPEERLMDALWPNEEADAARKSLDITVHRLRKLLGSHEAILVRDESFGLNLRLCWVDVWAFERRIAQTEAAEGEAALSAAASAVTLYHGNFLAADAEEPWTMKARERLRAKFVRLLESVAQADEAAGNWEKAIAQYMKGLEADDLVEAFHLGLMRCYRALGRPAEAITAFRRLRQTLSVVLGIAPSPAAEALAQELRKGSAARYP